MQEELKVTIRPFRFEDIPKKVEWINNAENNRFLHYDRPLEIDKTTQWFERVRDRNARYDAVIEADGRPCGTIGLLSIDRKNGKAEFYIAMGETDLKGRGVGKKASLLLLEHAFATLGLNRVYLYTEVDNLPAQRLFEKVGFIREGLLHQDILSRGKYVDRYVYGLCRRDD